MKIQSSAGNKGLIRTILLIVIALLVISYFGINLRSLVNAPTTQDNISYVATTTVTIWNNYLKVPVTFIWNLFVNLIWTPAINNLKDVKMGQTLNSLSSTTPNMLFNSNTAY